MGSTSIGNVLYRRSVAERTDRTYLNWSPEKQAPHTDIEHQISAMMLRFELLLGIVASCECCAAKYKEKVLSSRVNGITEETEGLDYNENQGTNT